jgi:hypothetical protein
MREKREQTRFSRLAHVAISNEGSVEMKRPREMADRSRELRDVSRLESGDGFLRETFTLPFNTARLKARQILDEYPAGGYMTIIENWRQLPDGQIEFSMRRLPNITD